MFETWNNVLLYFSQNIKPQIICIYLIRYLIRKSDILIVAIGQAHFVNKKMIKEGVHIIDVGINRVVDNSLKIGYRIVGDVDYDSVVNSVASITPVAGGVGPMTISMLLKNTIQAAELSIK